MDLLKRNWFHGLLTRDNAEDLLKSHGFEEGLFLVRESSSVVGDFVLSVVHGTQVIHYQIRRREDEALFSLSDEKKVIHGLDELIFYYKNQPNSGLQHSLGNFVPGLDCPESERLHGVENLLHRASAQGNLHLVSELLKCGDRDVKAKDHDGHTALHRAAFCGHEQVAIQLIKFGANVNSANSSGYTPLHIACQLGQSSVAEVLLIKDANPTLRNHITSWVPLHEAAWNGKENCVEMLLKYDAPVMPRTQNNETPSDLARSNGYFDLASKIDNWPINLPITSPISWLHSEITRKEAQNILTERGLENGMFLVRVSRRKIDTFVLTMCHNLKVLHYEIANRGVYFFFEEGPYMHSLEHLVDHYTRYPDGLKCTLQYPVGANSNILCLPGLLTKLNHYSTSPRKSEASRSQLDLPPQIPFRPKTQVESGCNLYPNGRSASIYQNEEDLKMVDHRREDIPIESLRLVRIIGEGLFGRVFLGQYMPADGGVREVAVKVCNNENEECNESFVREAQIMMALNHPCIVQFIGLSSGPPLMMVLELVKLGSLLEFITSQPGSVSEDIELPLWASQIARGMIYLEEQRYIHRDLAARNILLASKLQAKISDFGLSKVTSGNENFYTASKGGRWPVKWYAPECLSSGMFSLASDVWSYGVLLWEMYTLGEAPYEEMNASEVTDFIADGKRLPQPARASNSVYALMMDCWQYLPSNRPSFKELLHFFAENPLYANSVAQDHKRVELEK